MHSKHLYTLGDLASPRVTTSVLLKVIVFKSEGDVIKSLCLSQPDREQPAEFRPADTAFSALSLEPWEAHRLLMHRQLPEFCSQGDRCTQLNRPQASEADAVTVT